MESIVLRAFDREIVEHATILEFRKRPVGIIVVGVAIGVVAACFYGAGLALQGMERDYHALGSFAIGAAGLMAVVGACALAGAIVVLCVPRFRVFAVSDAAARTFRVRGRAIPFGEIARFSLVPSSNGFPTLCVETAARGSIPVWMATSSQAETLKLLAARLNAALAQVGAIRPAGAAAEPSAAGPVEQRLRTTIILVMGLLWTVGGYFFFRGLSFTSRLDPDGLHIPVWCAGLLILALGLYDWIKSRRR